MRITIEIDEQRGAAGTTATAPATGQPIDAGGPPAALLKSSTAPALAESRRMEGPASQPRAGNNAGPPPQHLIAALQNTAAPRANGPGASDGGAAPA